MTIKQCVVENCDSIGPLTKEMCSAHYQRNRRYGDPNIRKRRPSGPCSVDGCEVPARRDGMCHTHSARARRNNGDPGPAHLLRQWKLEPGSRHVLSTGYARIKLAHKHPRAYAGNWILEHIVVMEEKLGRPLLPGENVHHINGVRDDNRPENLELWVTMQPSGQRPEDMVAWAKEVLRRYGE